MAMGLGEAVGEQAELEYAHHEVKREKWEFENYPEVWYGMVWYGMVWYGMVWYGMV